MTLSELHKGPDTVTNLTWGISEDVLISSLSSLVREA